MKLFTSLRLLFEKEIYEIRELIMPPFIDPPDIRTTKIYSLAKIFRGQSSVLVSTIVPEQAAIYLDSSSHAFKAARPAPLTASIPRKPSKSEATTSNHTNSDKTQRKEKIAFSPRRGSEEEDQAPG